jgi:uncharacterized protein involved in response to NO
MFTLAMIAGILLPIYWALFFSGLVAAPAGLNPLTWHAHEMFYGFGWAVLGGFLLTASKNWVKIRGIHGAPLFLLALFWLFERYLMFNPGLLSELPWLRLLLLNSYMFGVSAYVLWTLWFHRKNDFYSDNFFFFLILVTFFFAKNLLLSSTSSAVGISMTTGLFRLPFAVMFERTLTQFMKTTEHVDLLRNKALDYSIKFSIFLSVFESFLPRPIAGTLLFGAGILLLVRWFLWSPRLGFKKFGNAIMYIGYLGLVLNMFLEGSDRYGHTLGTSTTALHTFTFLTMGVVISGMFVRICQGHTGRSPQFMTLDRIAITSMLAAAVCRLVAPLIYPHLYTLWIGLAGGLWSSCFFLLAVRLIPFLFKPRVDGKIH